MTARKLQYMAGEALADVGKNQPEMEISPSAHMSATQTAMKARELLDVSIEKQLSWTNEGFAFKEWRKAVERLGPFVFHFSLPTKELRAFSFSDHPTCIVVGTDDSSTGKAFSLFHELAHLIRRQAGLCNPFMEGTNSQSIEGWCNTFAGALLMPEALLKREERTLKELQVDITLAAVEITRVARHFKVSRYALLTRLLILNWVQQRQYDALVDFMHLTSPGKDFARGKPEAMSAKRCLSKCGTNFVGIVLEGVRSGNINIESAATYLGTHPENLSTLGQLIGS